MTGAARAGRTKQVLVVLLVALAVVLGIVIARNRPSADQQAVAYRQALMSVIGGQMQPLSAMQRAERPYDARLIGEHAANLAALSRMIPEAFERDTSSARSLQSAALADIWRDHAAFLRSAARLAASAVGLQRALAAGDAAQVRRALGALSSECLQCHRGFRAG